MNAHASLADVLFRPQLLSLLKPHLIEGDVRNVRHASTAARAAINATVTTVRLSPSSPPLCRDLGDVFPEASSLSITTTRACSTGDLTLLLGLVGSTSPAFVRKLQCLEVDLSNLSVTATTVTTLYRFFSRCTSLQELHVAWDRRCMAVFCGQGTTAAECRASMQAQLTAMHIDPVFLAPASWSAHGCLQKLHILSDRSAVGLECPAHAHAAVRTSSLRSLQLYYMPSSDSWQYMGCLASSLTNMALHVDELMPDVPVRAAVVAAVAQLTSLVQLELHLDLVESVMVGEHTFSVLPATWSSLARLTKLEVYEGDLDTSQVPCFLALRALKLHSCSLEKLPLLFNLTSLTSITYDNHSNDIIPAAAPALQQGGGYAHLAVPQQWKARMQELEWGFTWHNLDVITQLTSLTRLVLCAAEVGPAVGCSLAGLHALKVLSLRQAVVDQQEEGCHINATAFRPSFRVLEAVEVDRLIVLAMLARWTNVPQQLRLHYRNPCGAHNDAVDPSCFGNGWLQALVRGPDVVNIFLPSDSSVELLAQAAGALAVPPASANTLGSSGAASICSTSLGIRVNATMSCSVVFGTSVTAAACGRLFQAAQQLPRWRLSITHNAIILAGQAAPKVMPALPPRHVQQLQGRTFEHLEHLKLGNCSQLTAHNMGVLAGAVPNLVVLQLDHASGATDMAVCMFVACRLLAMVSITGCTRVTKEAAMALLIMLPKLESLEVRSICACTSRRACQQLLKKGWAATS